MSQKVLILGASGRFGRNSADAFAACGWQVHRFDRTRENLNEAARGVDLIVNGWNLPYTDWQQHVPHLTAQVIEAARLSGAGVLIPGNVYVFGPDTPPPWSERSAHRARNPLGRVRIEMEQAFRDSGVRTILLRAGDFIDTEASGNWYDKIMAKKLGKGVFTYPGDPDAPHAWAYLPDLARAAVALAEMRADLPDFADIPFPGYTVTGRELASTLQKVTGAPVRLRRFSYLPVQLVRPFWRMASSLLEMRYLWSLPHALDGRLFNELLPEFRDTTLEAALASTLPALSVEPKVHPNEAVPAGR